MNLVHNRRSYRISFNYMKMSVMHLTRSIKAFILRTVTVAVAAALLIAYSVTVIGCANSPTTYEKYKEPRKVHSRGGGGRGA